MPTLRKDDAKRVRESGGTFWYHFACPWCDDPSAHLGVAQTQHGVAFRCLRCGASSKTKKNHTLRFAGWKGTSGRSRQEPVEYNHIHRVHAMLKETVPLVRCGGKVGAKLRKRLREHWPKVADYLGPLGLRVWEDDPYRVLLPYVGVKNRLGVVVRQWEGDVKAKKYGAHPPAVFPSVGRIDPETRVVLTEGWADGAAVPHPYVPVMALGTGIKVTDVPGIVYLGYDNDDAGRKAAKRDSLRLLKAKRPHFIVRLKEGQDLADAGREAVGCALDRAVCVDSLRKWRQAT